jgi:hypothetical protein
MFPVMVISRLADTPELNNAMLVGASTLVLVLAVWTLLVISSFLVYQGIRASGIQALAAFGEGLYKRARLTAVTLSVLILILGIGLLGFYVLQRSGQRLMGRVEQALRERQLRETQRVHVEKFLAFLPSVINLALANALANVAVATLGVPALVEWFITTTLYILLVVTGGWALVSFLYFMSKTIGIEISGDPPHAEAPKASFAAA